MDEAIAAPGVRREVVVSLALEPGEVRPREPASEEEDAHWPRIRARRSVRFPEQHRLIHADHKLSVNPTAVQPSTGPTNGETMAKGNGRRKYEVTRQVLALQRQLDLGQVVTRASIEADLRVTEDKARDLLNFCRADLDVVEKKGPHNEIRLLAAPDRPADQEQVLVAAAADVAVAALTELRGTKLLNAFRRHAEGLRVALPEREQDHLDRWLNRLHFIDQQHPTRAERGQHVEALVSAIATCERCELEYESRSTGSVDTRIVEPWALIVSRNNLHLLAGKVVQDRKTTIRRTYALDAVVGVRGLGERFARPTERSLKPGTEFEAVFGSFLPDRSVKRQTVRVRALGSVGRMFKQRKFHGTQDERDLGDDLVEVTWNLRPCPALTSFLLSLAPKVEVIEPEPLRTAAASDCLRARAAAASL
jgi:predicted DNA-binding transcriptional regulator YafY